MSNLIFKDEFTDLRHWVGTAYPNTTVYISAPQSIEPVTLVSKRSYFAAEEMSIRFYDTLADFYLELFLGNTTILRFTVNSTFYTMVEGDVETVGSVARSNNWHTLRIDIKDTYRVFVDDVLIATTTRPTRRAFDVRLNKGRWDDFTVERAYSDDYQGGTGNLDDLKIQDLEALSDGTINYTVNPGYFYADDIEYYLFANMAVAPIVPNPSGIYTFPSGLPYRPGQPYFVVAEADMARASGYVRTPLDRGWSVVWNEVTENVYQPVVSGAYDPFLAYEAGTTRVLSLAEPLTTTKLVLTDEGGTPAQIRSDSIYIDYAKTGDSYGAFAVVTDKYGGPIPGAIVRWKIITDSDIIQDAGSSITNAKGVATTTISIAGNESFHLYAQTNPQSRPDWIRSPLTVADIQGSVFQLDNGALWLDSMEARTAIGHNIWGELWGTNPGEATGLGPPNPTTHGQWEATHGELRRPPIDQTLTANEATGSWNGTDFRTAYLALAPSLMTFMDPIYVARKGYWGQRIVSGAQIQAGSDSLGPIASGQILNPSETYEILRDFGVATGSYNTVRTGGGTYTSVFYAFYQPGNLYAGSIPNWAGSFYFRGVVLYNESLDQSLSRVQDIISNAALQQ